jgi:parvulin-like peptidyl-prolyl isomerase
VQATSGRKVAGVTWNEAHGRLAIISVAAALLVLVLGMFVYRWYDYNFARPNHIVLSVGNQEFKLNYYTDRLYQFVQANQQQQLGGNLPLYEQQLLTKLEEEALTIQLAKEKGVDLSDDEITREIASELGVPVGGTGSSFDTLYRARLKTLKISDGNYRHLAEASLANRKLLEKFKNEIGETGEGVTIRTVVTASKDEADKVVERIKGGEDMGTVAQTTSTELDSKQQDGLLLPEPARLLPENIQKAIQDKPAGTELFGPVDVQQNWWVFRIDKRDPAYAFSDSQKSQLAQVKLDDAIKEKRATTPIKRNLTGDDIDWALKNAG